MSRFTFITRVAILSCLLSPMLRAETPPKDAEGPKRAPAAYPSIVVEKDQATGEDRFYLVDPQGQKRLLQALPSGQWPRGWQMAPGREDYFSAWNSIPPGERYIIGVELQSIPKGLHDKLGIDGEYGLVVGQVLPEKPAAQAGVQQFDLLLKIDGTPVSQPGDVVRIVNKAQGAPLTLTLLRDHSSLELKLTPEKAEDAAFPSLPDGMRFVGPGMIVDPGNVPGLGGMQLRMEAMQAELQQLHDRLDQLTEQLNRIQPPLLEAPKKSEQDE
jgi:hypothetical protein